MGAHRDPLIRYIDELLESETWFWLASVEPLYDAGGSHDFGHAVRVCVQAAYIAQEEGTAEHLAAIAGLLHDAGRAEALRAGGADDHEVRSARIATSLMEECGYSRSAVASVATAIERHRFSRSARVGDERADPLAAAVADADRLDALGYVGVARLYSWLGEHGWPSLAGGRRSSLLPADAFRAHWEDKLKHLAGGMATDTGRELARERERHMVGFLSGLESELTRPGRGAKFRYGDDS